jgi:hypothetical protein
LRRIAAFGGHVLVAVSLSQRYAVVNGALENAPNFFDCRDCKMTVFDNRIYQPKNSTWYIGHFSDNTFTFDTTFFGVGLVVNGNVTALNDPVTVQALSIGPQSTPSTGQAIAASSDYFVVSGITSGGPGTTFPYFGAPPGPVDVLLSNKSIPFGSPPISFPATFDPNVYTPMDVPCFCAGTQILTENGEVPIEDLKVGDLVRCVAPEIGLRPVIWKGSQKAQPRGALLPVRIVAGALADGVPARDLLVSPGHSLMLDGHLVQAQLLLDGATIHRDPAEAWPEITWWHVELDGHAVLLTEGAPTESYLDDGNRHLLGVVALDAPPRAVYAELACLPVMEPGEALTLLRTRLSERAEAMGYGFSADPAPRLLLADGRVLWPDMTGMFKLPQGAAKGPVRLLSRTAVPAETMSNHPDLRRLGVCIHAIEVRGATIDGADPMFDDTPGFLPLDRDGSLTWRWTTGDAELPPALLARLAGEDSALRLVDQATGLRYPTEPAPSNILQLRDAAARRREA